MARATRGGFRTAPHQETSLDDALMDRKQATRLAGLFKLLGSEARLRLLHALALRGELFTDELAEITGRDAVAVRLEAGKLVRHGVVRSRRVGRRSAYRLAHPGLMGFLSGSLAVAQTGSNGRLDGRMQPTVRRWLELQPRQREILGLIAEGRSVADIAVLLDITEATARTHIHKILAGLGVPSQVAAVAAARRHGLVL